MIESYPNPIPREESSEIPTFRELTPIEALSFDITDGLRIAEEQMMCGERGQPFQMLGTEKAIKLRGETGNGSFETDFFLETGEYVFKLSFKKEPQPRTRGTDEVYIWSVGSLEGQTTAHQPFSANKFGMKHTKRPRVRRKPFDGDELEKMAEIVDAVLKVENDNGEA